MRRNTRLNLKLQMMHQANSNWKNRKRVKSAVQCNQLWPMIQLKSLMMSKCKKMLLGSQRSPLLRMISLQRRRKRLKWKKRTRVTRMASLLSKRLATRKAM